MTTATLDIYKLLLEAGIAEDKAEPLARELVSKADAREFATKADISELKDSVRTLEVRMYQVVTAQTVLLLGAMITLVQLVR